jgi:hypothetical protein
MDGGSSAGSDARFAAYVEALGAVLGHADRQQPMYDSCLARFSHTGSDFRAAAAGRITEGLKERGL